jgi:Zn(2)-Cys(6) binuclear cluster domain-containing protein
MPSSAESRQIKRPRLSLSCVVCRRRKVRCGREQPECSNCMRIKEKCIYEIGIRNRSFDRVSQKSHTEPDSRSENGILESRIDQSSPYSEKPANWVNNDSSNILSKEFGSAAKQITPGISPVSGPLSYHGSSSNVESNFPSSNTSPALSPQPKHRSLNLAYSNVPSWEEALQEASDNGRNNLWGVKTGVTAQQPATDQYHRGIKWSSMSDSPVYEPPFYETVAMDEFPTRPQTPQSDRSILPSDYLSVRRGARVRYIGKAFWGIITGRVRNDESQTISLT